MHALIRINDYLYNNVSPRFLHINMLLSKEEKETGNIVIGTEIVQKLQPILWEGNIIDHVYSSKRKCHL